MLQDLASFDTMLTHVADPRRMPEALLLREVRAQQRWRGRLRKGRASAMR